MNNGRKVCAYKKKCCVKMHEYYIEDGKVDWDKKGEVKVYIGRPKTIRTKVGNWVLFNILRVELWGNI